eukprot:g37436.t1
MKQLKKSRMIISDHKYLSSSLCLQAPEQEAILAPSAGLYPGLTLLLLRESPVRSDAGSGPCSLHSTKGLDPCWLHSTEGLSPCSLHSTEGLSPCSLRTTEGLS